MLYYLCNLFVVCDVKSVGRLYDTDKYVYILISVVPAYKYILKCT